MNPLNFLRRVRFGLYLAIPLFCCFLALPDVASTEVLLDEDCQRSDTFYGAGWFGITRIWREQEFMDWDQSARLTLFDYTTAEHGEVRVPEDVVGRIAYAAAAANDQYILFVWTKSVPTTYHLIGRLVDSECNFVDQTILDVAYDPDFSFHNPAVAADPETGNFLVVWNSQDYGAPAYGIHGILVETTGGTISVPDDPTTYWEGAAGAPDVTYATFEVGGDVYPRFLMTWWDDVPGGNWNIQVHDADVATGEAPGDPTLLHWITDCPPKIASDGENAILVAESGGAIWGQRLTALSSEIGSRFQIRGLGEDPDIAASDSEYLVVWDEVDDILGRHVQFNGTMPDGAIGIVLSEGEWQRLPTVASNGSVFVVAFERENISPYPPYTDVYYQRVGDEAFTFVNTDVDNEDFETRGVAWGDWIASPYPEDLADLYVANTGGAANEHFANDGSSLLLTSVNTGDVRNSQAATFADYDNDGDLDLFVSNASAANELYHNIGGYFNAVGAAVGIDGTDDSRSVAWGDINNDGLLDLVVANKNAANKLYVQISGGTFLDRSGRIGAESANSEGIVFVDFDDDGDQDIYVGNAGQANRLYVNDGAGFFNEQAAEHNLADTGSARSVSWADFDGDGDLDCYITKYAEPNALYRNDDDQFVDAAATLGVDDSGRSESACWADVDLDGDLDLFVANYNDPDCLYRNDGAEFVDIGSFIGLDSQGASLGAAWADFDGDGDEDLCFGEYGGTNRVLINELDTGNHLQVRLAGTGSNASAIGAKLTATIGGESYVRWVGGGNGYLSQNDLMVTFGLGSATQVDVLQIDWPNGQVEVFNSVAGNQLVEYVENESTAVESAVPAQCGLVGSYPNPFNPQTTIEFALDRPQWIEIAVYDLTGGLLNVLAKNSYAAGNHSVVWNGKDASGRAVPSGTYVVRLETESRTEATKVMLLR